LSHRDRDAALLRRVEDLERVLDADRERLLAQHRDPRAMKSRQISGWLAAAC